MTDPPPVASGGASIDLEAIEKRIKLAQRIHGVSFDGYGDDEPREPVDIQRDRDRAALMREVQRLQAENAELVRSLRSRERVQPDDLALDAEDYRAARDACLAEAQWWHDDGIKHPADRENYAGAEKTWRLSASRFDAALKRARERVIAGQR